MMNLTKKIDKLIKYYGENSDQMKIIESIVNDMLNPSKSRNSEPIEYLIKHHISHRTVGFRNGWISSAHLRQYAPSGSIPTGTGLNYFMKKLGYSNSTQTKRKLKDVDSKSVLYVADWKYTLLPLERSMTLIYEQDQMK